MKFIVAFMVLISVAAASAEVYENLVVKGQSTTKPKGPVKKGK